MQIFSNIGYSQNTDNNWHRDAYCDESIDMIKQVTYIGTLISLISLILLCSACLNYAVAAGPPGPQFTGNIVTTQITTGAAKAADQEILRIELQGVQVAGGAGWNCTDMGFTLNLTDAADVDNAKLYYTGASTTFSTATQFGTPVVITSASQVINFSFSQVGTTGMEYYWLAFDVSAAATDCNTLDAKLNANAVVITGDIDLCCASPFPAADQDPAGNREITGVGCWNYCIPDFATASEHICRVIFNTIDNSSTCATGGATYEDFTSISTPVSPGSSYDITVYGNTAGAFTNYINVFIDFNNDGDFVDAGEEFQIGTITNCSNCSVMGSITIAAGAVIGTTTMRVMKKYNAYAATACNTAGYGQAEDYELNICGASSPTPPITTGAARCGTGTLSLTA
ncbi:MAG: hypothetical protein JKX73_06940, partial [Flavobacteriales bacterium]|nr:hypothetical protein [Flavobacteriales bacterium]